MYKVDKNIYLNDNRVIRYGVNDGYALKASIFEGVKDDGEISKGMELTIGTDYHFSAYVNVPFDDVIKMNEISFEYDENHPLYLPFLYFLKKDQEVIVDDDDTCLENQKYMIVKKEDDKIIVTFTNTSEFDKSFNRFSILVKNVEYDLRSKIDWEDKDTKDRLYDFFFEANRILSDYHLDDVDYVKVRKNI